MPERVKYKIPADYYIVFSVCFLFLVFAFILESPAELLINYLLINTSRSVLVSDYIAMAGLGATLINSAISCIFFLILLIVNKCDSNGRILAALFLTIGFSFFGKNMFNTLPLCFGVFLYAKIRREKFSVYVIYAMFCATIAPLVSEIAFLGDETGVIKIITAYSAGIFVGFIFPVITESAKRMHRGYCLYNSGIAGGFIATFTVGILRSMDIEVTGADFWDTAHTKELAIAVYIFSALLIIYGFFSDEITHAPRNFIKILKEKDIHDNDYLLKHGNYCYINIGIMCVISTTAMLALKIPINGPVLGGILSVAGFAAAGKHVINTIPILIGSIAAAHLNHIEVTAPANALSILFSTGLSPIADKRGWFWGIAAGFMHVSVAVYIGLLNGGLNLYNNGFAGGFVAITLMPLVAFTHEIWDGIKKKKSNPERKEK